MKFVLLSLFAVFFTSSLAQAGNHPGCTAWEKVGGCSFDGDGVAYTRDCSKALEMDHAAYENVDKVCWRQNGDFASEKCLERYICMPNDQGRPDHPQQIDGECTAWYKIRGTKCSRRDNSRTDNERWKRACTVSGVNFGHLACTPRGKRYPDKGDWSTW